MKLGVLVSGKGSNLRNLVELGFDVVAVATNRPSCGGAAFARGQSLPLGAFSQRRFASLEERDAAMAGWLRERGVELIVCAGYDRVLSAAVLEAFEGRILNLHPSLLPNFAGGMDAVERALEAGVRYTGCTVHLVNADLDGGPVLLQAGVPIERDDSRETLHARIQAEEHRILPEAIRLMERRLAPSAAQR